MSYIASLERSKTIDAVRSVWGAIDGENTITDFSLAGLLTNSPTAIQQQPRSLYFTYKKYSEIKGNSLKINGLINKGYDGIAGYSPSENKIRMLIGHVRRAKKNNMPKLLFKNLSGAGLAGSIRVKAYLIKSTGKLPSSGPALVLDKTYAVPQNSATVRLPNLSPLDAYFVEVSNAQ